MEPQERAAGRAARESEIPEKAGQLAKDKGCDRRGVFFLEKTAPLVRTLTRMRTTAPIELLESRIAPANVITFAGGKLAIVGDSAPSSISIEQISPGVFQVASGSNDLVFDGAPATNLVALTGSITSVDLKMEGGADSLTMVRLSVAKNMTFSGGDGDNTFVLQDTSIGGNLSVKNGTGSDNVQISGSAVTIGKNLTIDQGAGGSTIGSSSVVLSVGGLTKIKTGSDNDSVTLNGNFISLGKGIQIDAGGGVNSTTIQTSNGLISGGNIQVINLDQNAGTVSTIISSSGLDLRRDIVVRNGDGDSQTSLVGNGRVRGNVQFSAGDGTLAMNISGANLKLDKNVTFQGGTGTLFNNYSISGGEISIGGSAKVTSGAGDDFLNLSASTLTVGGGTTLNAGAGINNVIVSGSVVRIGGSVEITSLEQSAETSLTQISSGLLEVGGSVRVTQGNGDSQTIVNTSAALIKGSLKVNTNDGSDTVNITTPFLTTKGGIQIATGEGNSISAIFFAGGTAGSVKIAGGSGDDNAVITGTGKVASIAIDLGQGANTGNVQGDSSVGLDVGRLKFVSNSTSAQSDSLSVTRALIRGVTDIAMGEGTSNVSVDSIAALGNFSLATNDGADVVAIETSGGSSSLFEKLARIQLGLGADSLTIGGGLADRRATFNGAFIADGGDGSDTRSIDPNGNVFSPRKTVVNFELGS